MTVYKEKAYPGIQALDHRRDETIRSHGVWRIDSKHRGVPGGKDPRERSVSALAALTCEVYERNAAFFDAKRSRQLHERAWLDRLLRLADPGGAVLDLGCGTGDPIAAYVIEQGVRVIGIDAAPAMIGLARERYPAGDWRVGDMRCLDLPTSVRGHF